MQDSLLWVYEGQTQFWGYVLAARSGLMPAEDARAEIARIAAYYDSLPGRTWRPLADTTNDPIVQSRRPQPWGTWMRGEDYYSEGMLIWLDVDAKLRELSGGRRSMNDFARAFFGQRDGDTGISTYRFEDVAATLNAIAPFDWAAFLHARIDDVRPHAPLDWLAADGYRLAWRDTPTAYWTSREHRRKIVDLGFSIGLIVGEHAEVASVTWGSPAFEAGVTAGATIVAVNGREYSDDRLRNAVRDARGGHEPIRLLVKRGERYREVAIDYHGGLRYPVLERTGTGPSGLDALLTPLE